MPQKGEQDTYSLLTNVINIDYWNFILRKQYMLCNIVLYVYILLWAGGLKQ